MKGSVELNHASPLPLVTLSLSLPAIAGPIYTTDLEPPPRRQRLCRGIWGWQSDLQTVVKFDLFVA